MEHTTKFKEIKHVVKTEFRDQFGQPVMWNTDTIYSNDILDAVELVAKKHKKAELIGLTIKAEIQRIITYTIE